MTIHKRRLILKIGAPEIAHDMLSGPLSQLPSGNGASRYSLCNIQKDGDSLSFHVDLLEHEIDPFLKRLSGLIDEISKHSDLFPLDMDIEISDSASPEYVSGPLTAPLAGDWKICILPTDHRHREADPAPAAETIFLKTGWAFGTGRHPSTMGAAEALCFLNIKNLLAGAHVLDVGTGTGILAILAAKMGALKVLALDVDEKILATARQNIMMNGLSGSITLCAEPIDRLNLKNQDVIVANLTPSVLFRLLDKLAGVLAGQGCLVLSGYRSGLQPELRQMLYRRGLESLREFEIEGWGTEIFRFVRSKT